MFGTNEIVGKSYFKDAPSKSLLVASSFFTLQGEGPFSGLPSYFIRLAKCNKNCGWCDASFDTGTWMTFDEILAKSNRDIKDFFINNGMDVPERMKKPNKPVVLVITGGEPALQTNLSNFLYEINKYFYELQIESNGTIPFGHLPYNTLLVISPKCLEKDGKAVKYLNPHKDVMLLANCYKFVVCHPDHPQFGEYSNLPDWAYSTGKPVYISPMNLYINQSLDIPSFWAEGLLDKEWNRKNHTYAAMLCMKYNFRLSLQTHLFVELP